MTSAKSKPILAIVAACLLALAMTLLLGSPAFNAPASFSDVPASHPYYTAVADLSSRGIINGFDDGTYGPDRLVTRQQFAKMITRTMGLPVDEGDICPFVDVQKSTPGSYVSPADILYPDHYVAVCAKNGITEGKTPTTFDPYGKISRYQVITMVVRAINNSYPGLLVVPPSSFTCTWDPALSPDHGENAWLAEYGGLLAGLPLGSLDPFTPMPRGEVAQVLHNLLAKVASASATTTTQGSNTTATTTTTTTSSTTTSSTTTTTQASTTTTTQQSTVEGWINYKISTVPWNTSPLLHGNHAAWLGFVGGFYQVFVHDITSGVTSQITSGAAWSHEYLDIQGNWIALQADDGSQSDIFLYDIAAQKLTRLTNTYWSEEHPSISSGRVVWSGYDGQDWELFLYDTASGQTTQLTHNTLDEQEPDFDGEWIVSSGYWFGATDVDGFLNNASGSFSRLLRVTGPDYHFRVRGNFVVWEHEDTWDVYLHDIALNKTKKLTTVYGTDPFPSGKTSMPTLSMDGGRIVWEGWDGNDNEIVVYDIAAGTTKQLTNNSSWDISPYVSGDEVVWVCGTDVGRSYIYYCDLAQPGYGPLEQVTIDMQRIHAARVDRERVVWTRGIDLGEILLARKVDVPSFPTQ